MKTVIMAGGKGTRISELFPDIPKPMIPISNGVETKPVLQWEIESLRDQGFTGIVLTVSHLHEKIEEYFGDGSRFGVHVDYFVEDVPLGNAGALFKLGLDDDFLLLNADAVFDVDFNRMVAFHRSHRGLVTLFTHPNSHPYDSGLIVAESDGSVLRWLAKEDARPQWYKNRVNAGLHVISPRALEMCCVDAGVSGDDKIDPSLIGRVGPNGKIDPSLIGKPGPDGKIVKVDLDRQILKPLCGTGLMYCYDSPEYVKDMGTPDRFYAVSRDFASGVVAAKNLANRQRAIFLDRDGTINKYVGFLRDIDSFELLPGVAEAIRLINESGYLAIVATNQPVIARGEVTFEELDEIHNKMETLLGAEGAYVDGIFFCPHHPDKGFEGEIPELKINCDCRKPKPGMLLKAAADYNIDLLQSWMIGDGENDVLAGKAAGCRTALICQDADVPDFGQDVTAMSLLEIIKKI